MAGHALKIDLIDPIKQKDDLLSYLTQKLGEAFLRQGIDTRVLQPKNNPEDFVKEIFNHKPDYTLSFNGLLPDHSGRFFADLIQVPHIAFLTVFPTPFHLMRESKKTSVITSDQNGLNFLNELGIDRTFFLPLAIDKNLDIPFKEKKTDFVLFASSLAPQTYLFSWQKKLGKEWVKAIQEIAEEVIHSQELSYYEVLVKVADKKVLSLNCLDIIPFLIELEDYIEAVNLFKTLDALKGYKVHIYSEIDKTSELKKHFPEFQYHHAKKFSETLNIMAKAKFVICPQAVARQGFSLRFLYSLALDAIPITNESAFLDEHFEGNYISSTADIDAYLKDDNLREKFVIPGREKTFRYHNWDERVKLLQDSIEAII